MKVSDIFNHKDNTQMLLKIQNEKQLKAIASLVLNDENAKRIFADVKTMTTFDLQSVFNEHAFVVLTDKFADDPKTIIFVAPKSGIKVYSYSPKSNMIRDHELDHDYFSINGDQSQPEFNDDEIEAAERLFLTLCGFDLSNGWMNEDLFGYKDLNRKYALAVFGE